MHPLMLALFVAVPLAGEAPIIPIADFVNRDEDCKIVHYGGKDVKRCDFQPAFEQIQLQLKESGQVAGRVIIPPGDFYVAKVIPICVPLLIEGSGPNVTILNVARGVTTFRTMHRPECRSLGLGDGGAGTTFTGMTVREVSGPNVTVPNFGFLAETRTIFQSVDVDGFVQGIRISGDVKRSPSTNTNSWRMMGVRVVNAEHADIYLDGGDANAGVALQFSVTTACRRGAYWAPTLGPCANLMDRSFLGNTYIGLHASSSYDPETGTNYPNYVFEGQSQKSVIIAYSESDDMPPQLSPHSIWLGFAALTTVGGGFGQVGPEMNGISVRNARDAANVVELRAGSQAAPGTGLELAPSQTPSLGMTQPFRLKADPANKRWLGNVANIGAGNAWTIGGTADAPGGYGGLSAPKGILLPQNLQLSVSTGTPSAALCTVGTVYYEGAPKAGGARGYQCVTGKSGPIWQRW